MTGSHPYWNRCELELGQVIKAIPTDRVRDVYVLALDQVPQEGDRRRMTLRFSWNTNGTARARTTEHGEGARWNPGFFAGFSAAIVGDLPDLRRDWLEANGWWYTDDDFGRDEDRVHEVIVGIEGGHAAGTVDLVRRLHASDLLTGTIGAPVPILIHGTDDHDPWFRWTREANPNGLVEPVAQYARQLPTKG